MNKLQSIICIFTLSLLWACSKDDGLSGPPSVRSVTLLDSARQDSAFTRALPGTLVLITGDNLGDITSVSFNGMNAYFNPAYNTNTHLIITIPDDAPTEATDPDVPNTIHIVTSHGETSYSFVVDIPPPSIFAISNENAMPGDSLFIAGSALWLIEKIQFPGGREVTAFKADAEGTIVRLVMPDLGTDTGRITVVAKYGSATSNGPLNDHQSADVISNFTNDGETGELPRLNWAWWGAERKNDATLFPGTRGYYLHNIFGGVGADDPAWWNGGRSGNFNDVPMFTAAIMTQQASDYALKFEVNTKEPWTTAICVLRFGETYAYRLMPFAGAPGASFHTENKWVTATIPLSEFKTAADGKEGTGTGAATMGQLLKANGVVAFGFRIISEDKPIEVFNAAFDNFRIIKIK
ncbi:glycan-binding surface protein [Chitinophaga sp. YIM B06452]|uniref:glycan-binding surface protein n=1 Tax=Chitinophaga sp. YIM B06452 TaxID=3082158 RepID=UPI0031FF24F2